MDIKNAIRQRRQERIRQLLEEHDRKNGSHNKPPIIRGASPLQPPPSGQGGLYRDTSAPAAPDRRAQGYRTQHPRSTDESDPERAWKANPYPWLGWDKDEMVHSRKGGGFPGDSGDGGHTFGRELLQKTVAAAVIFAAVWGMFRLDPPWTRGGQQFVRQALTQEMNFEAVAAWYREVFDGAPTFIPIFNPNPGEATETGGTVKLPLVAPVQGGAVVRSFAELLSGVEIAGESGARVRAAETGRVTHVADEGGKGTTIVIQHAGNRVTVYGALSESNVAQNDWVEAGQTIGKLATPPDGEPALLYFAVKQNGRYVDPSDVMPLD